MLQRPWHKNYPPQVPPEISFEKITIPQMLIRTARKFPDQAAIYYEGNEISYRALENLVNRFARALLDLGVQKGDRIAVLLPNIPQIVVVCQACLRIGAITVMNNPLYTEFELTNQLLDSGASLLVTTLDHMEKVLNLRRKTNIKKIIFTHIKDYAPGGANFNIIPLPDDSDLYWFLALVKRFPHDPVADASEWNQVANIMYTGGTTGVSKGVMQTHENLSCNVQQYSVWLYDTIDGQESWPIIYPIFHSAGYTMQNKSIYTGWKSIFVSTPSPDVISGIIEDTRPTLLPGVSTLFVGLIHHPKFKELDMSSIKAFMTGGGPLALETLNQLKSKKNVPVINVYGLTEASPVATATPWRGWEKPGSVGVPYPSTDLMIVDISDDAKELPAGEPGEILIKGPQVMKGYLNRPKETETTLKGGWLHTGDIGFLDEDGYLTIIDRKKDVIVASGFNIYPKEIDELLFAHPKILEACTIGVPDDYRGETVKSYIVLKKKEQMSKEAVMEYCRQYLAPYKVPKIIEFTDSLPKSAIGKILRKELREINKRLLT
jgi:long-chain acyl-CoA synthetase